MQTLMQTLVQTERGDVRGRQALGAALAGSLRTGGYLARAGVCRCSQPRPREVPALLAPAPAP